MRQNVKLACLELEELYVIKLTYCIAKSVAKVWDEERKKAADR